MLLLCYLYCCTAIMVRMVSVIYLPPPCAIIHPCTSSATKVCQTLNALQAIERQFNDDLVDDNGKNVEAEYYALRNAIASLKSAYEDIKDV